MTSGRGRGVFKHLAMASFLVCSLAVAAEAAPIVATSSPIDLPNNDNNFTEYSFGNGTNGALGEIFEPNFASPVLSDFSFEFTGTLTSANLAGLQGDVSTFNPVTQTITGTVATINAFTITHLAPAAGPVTEVTFSLAGGLPLTQGNQFVAWMDGTGLTGTFPVVDSLGGPGAMMFNNPGAPPNVVSNGVFLDMAFHADFQAAVTPAGAPEIGGAWSGPLALTLGLLMVAADRRRTTICLAS